ncbi:MAG TPA: hypothetical protein VNU64_03640 [Burkholderiales bacterium]|nr:hypothetical protein [Burkholderiales bacterium]
MGAYDGLPREEPEIAARAKAVGIALLVVSLASRAADLNLCTPAGCAAVMLPESLGSVLAAYPLSEDTAARIEDGFALNGDEVIPPHDPAARLQIPIGVGLLPRATAMSFGSEGRAQVEQRDGRLVLDCAAGSQPAGVLIRLAGRGLPQGAALSASARFQSTGNFGLGASDTRRSKAGDPLPLGTLSARPLELPATLDWNTLESFTVSCPSRAGRLELSELAIQPNGKRPAPRRALWARPAQSWMNDAAALLAKAERAGADTLFVTVPVMEGSVEQPQRLAEFVSAANARRVAIWAVLGDPRAVTPDGQAQLSKVAAAFDAYNRSAAPAAKLAGVQYDIQPYLNPGYAAAPEAWQEAYLATLQELRQQAALPVDVAIPFWWNDPALLEPLAEYVDSITVMDYRTDPLAIRSLAQPFLDWGAQHGRRVRIALEYGPIPDRTHRHYRPAQEGDVALVSASGTPALVKLAERRPAAPPIERVYQQSHDTIAPGRNITFAGQREALLKITTELEQLWSAWPGFAGIALHGFEP